MATVEFKPEFGYVVAVAAASYVVHHMYMAFGVVGARKKYNITYPDLYADEKNCTNPENRKKFNCVQRAHQNSLENQPVFLSLLLLAGLKYPMTSAIAGATYLLGRILYFKGYSTGKPDKRMIGAVGYFGSFTLLGCCIKFAFDLITSKK